MHHANDPDFRITKEIHYGEWESTHEGAANMSVNKLITHRAGRDSSLGSEELIEEAMSQSRTMLFVPACGILQILFRLVRESD